MDAGDTDAGGPDAGADAAIDDSGADAGGADGGPSDGGPRPDAARPDAGPPVDAGPPPATGPYADLVITGAQEHTYRFVPPANRVHCMQEGTRPNLYIGLSTSPDGLTGETFEINAAGVRTGTFLPRVGSERAGNFAILYRVSAAEAYAIDASSLPCTFEVTSISGGELEAIFDCHDLRNLAASASERVSVAGRVRCAFP